MRAKVRHVLHHLVGLFSVSSAWLIPGKSHLFPANISFIAIHVSFICAAVSFISGRQNLIYFRKATHLFADLQ